MKVILDSNVIIAAFSGRGLCNSLFELCIEKYTVIISRQILEEVSKNLHLKFKMPEKNVDLIINYLNEFCLLKNFSKPEKQISRDKDDDGIISLALDNSIEYIITGDKDLLVLKKYKSVKIINPREFWEIAKKNEK